LEANETSTLVNLSEDMLLQPEDNKNPMKDVMETAHSDLYEVHIKTSSSVYDLSATKLIEKLQSYLCKDTSSMTEGKRRNNATPDTT
jgi:hypothetical protein